MAEHDEREDASRRYRELPREEPPAALDAAILAHARRAVEARSSRPWYFSLAAAAVLVLAVALTWNIEREQPDRVAVTSAPPAPPAAAEEKAQAPAAPAPEPARRRAARPKVEDSAGERELAKQQAPAAEMRADRAQPRPQPGAAARSEIMRQEAFAETPEQWLERITRLRAEGKHDEADKALAAFRKRYPDFRMAEETRKKVER